MNSVNLIGRMTKDPDVRYNTSGTAFAAFSIAIDRGKGKDGKSMGTDYPNIKCIGKTAELVEKYLGKGRLVGIAGKIQTGSYEKDGRKVYTMEVLADRVEFLDYGEKKDAAPAADDKQSDKQLSIPEGFAQLTDDDIPF